jgi:adenine phosphoribosyltransferase
MWRIAARSATRAPPSGGTLQAAIHLLRKVGANVVGAACIIELAFLTGRAKLDVPFRSMISYES